jgi:hypothetical protein
MLFASVWFFFSYQLSHLDTYKEYITKTVSKELNRDITFETGKATLTFRAGMAFKFTNVVIKEKDFSSNLLNIKTAFFRVNIFPLLRNRVVFREVILDQPRLSLKRDRAGVLNIADLMTKEKKRNTMGLKELTIEKGSVTFLDQAAIDKGLLTSLDNLHCKIDSSFWGNKSSFRITTFVIEDKNKAELSLKGTFLPASSEKPIYESTVNADIRLKGTDIKHYHSYLKNLTPIEQLTGYLDVETTFSGTLSNFTSKGNVTVKDVLLYYPSVFRNNLKPRMVQVDYDLTRDTGRLKLDVARIAIDRFEAKGSFAINETDKEDPLWEANAVTSTFSLKEMQSYIPWGIIPEHVGNFIDIHVKDGNFRLVEGKLKGRLSQIAHMKKQESAGVLSLRAEVNKGVFAAGNAAPEFHDISGILELKNRQFLLRNMTGRFGNSPCTLEGGISDFALPKPVEYTAAMTLQPARDEVLWLLGKEKFHALSFNGASTLLLSGKGTARNYHINAHWDLTDNAYTYPNVMEKPRTRKNQLTAEITLNKDVVNVSSFNYDLPPVSVSGSAMYRFSGKKPLSLHVQSKAFDIREAVPILPVLKAFNPAGTCSLAIAGRGDVSDHGSIQWNGNVFLTNVSFKPLAGVKLVKGLTGKAVFKGNSMETSLFKARIGESDIQGKLRIDDFRKPKVVCQFNTDLLRTADLGLQSPEGEVNLHDVKGHIAIEDKLIGFDNLSFGLGKSSFNLSGDVRDFADPKITAALTSPYINYDDVARIMTLKYPKQEDGTSSRMKLNATLLVDEGTFNGVDFRKLNAGLKFTPGILNIETLEAGLFEGNLKAKGKVDIHPAGQNHYEANISIDRVSLEKLQSFFEVGDRRVTGNLSFAGDVSATGRNADDLKKTAEGAFQIKAEKGVLKKFSVLSKIFSLLNVFQLAKFQLPDMAKDGMPYKTITAHLFLKDGVFSSEDFFIDSDAMQISGVGKVDFIKKDLDFIAGVHPLQTLDTIAAKIPIAGWLITDEKGKLITVHFKVDGTWDNPNVSPMQAKSMGKGTLDIFRRIFQLPGKLITDTGEVIFGH